MKLKNKLIYSYKHIVLHDIMNQVDIKKALYDIRSFRQMDKRYIHHTTIHSIENAVEEQIKSEQEWLNENAVDDNGENYYKSIPPVRLPVSLEFGILCYHNVPDYCETRTISFRDNNPNEGTCMLSKGTSCK